VRTIADLDHGRDNNYQLIRLIAASLVVLAHSYFLSTAGDREPLRMLTGYKHFGELGVQVFFVISGYLVTKSFVSRAGLPTFLAARALRIFPALIVAVVFTVFVIGAIATTLPLKSYLVHDTTLYYLFGNVTLLREAYELPGVFADNPLPNAVNGSLWTLFTEVRLYLLVGFAGAVGFLAGRSRFNIVLMFTVLLGLYFPELFQFLRHLLNLIFIDPRLPLYFLFGAVCFFNRDVIPVHWAVIVVLALIALVLHGTSLFPYAFDVAACYGVLFCAYAPYALWLRKFNSAGDYSYGLFIYAFPVQQWVVTHWRDIELVPMIAASFAATLPLAIASWHWIEKPALAFKARVASR
jgi:peptidoglycan/LPS O-acetylase OafA/YrhL